MGEPAVDHKITMTCVRCKRDVSFQSFQWSKKCECGNLVILSRGFRNTNAAAPPAKCSYCRDTGVIVIEKQVDGQLYEYVYRCLCEAGWGRTETAIPFATDVDMTLRK